MKGCEIVLSKPIGSGRHDRPKPLEGWHEHMPRHAKAWPLARPYRVGLAKLFAQQVDMDADQLNHVADARFGDAFLSLVHGKPNWFPMSRSLRPVSGPCQNGRSVNYVPRRSVVHKRIPAS